MNFRDGYVDIDFSYTAEVNNANKQFKCSYVQSNKKIIAIYDKEGAGREIFRGTLAMFKQLMYDKNKDHYPIFNEAYKHLGEIIDKLDDVHSKE